MSDKQTQLELDAVVAPVKKTRAKKAVATDAAAATTSVKKPRASKAAEGAEPVKTRKRAAKAPVKIQVSQAERNQMVETAAYFIAERRGFHGGCHKADWEQAEREVDANVEVI